MSEETQNATCKKCSKEKKEVESPKKCDKCEKLKKGMKPYVIMSLIMMAFMFAGVYSIISYLIELFSN
jgi:hypothetical protein